MICFARNDKPHVLVDSQAREAHSPRRGIAKGWIGSCRNASSIKANAIRNPEQFPQCKWHHSRFVRPEPVFAPVFAPVFDAAPGFDCSPLNACGLTEIWEPHAPAALGALWAPGWEALSGFWDALTLLFHLKHVLSSPSPFFFFFWFPYYKVITLPATLTIHLFLQLRNGLNTLLTQSLENGLLYCSQWT